MPHLTASVRRNTTKRTAIVLLSLPIVLTGCGEGTTNKQLSKAEFVAKADSFCRRGDQMRKAGGPPPPRQFNPNRATGAQIKAASTFFAADLTATRFEASKIKTLGLPKQDADTVRKLDDYLSNTLVPAETKVVAAARKGDAKTFKNAFAPIMAGEATLAPLQQHLGFKVCGN